MKKLRILKKPMIMSVLILSYVSFATNAIADTTPSKSTYNWTGAYVGGFVGGASGTDVTSSTNGTITFPGYDASGSSNYSTSSSFMGGGTVGYNWQIGQTPYLIALEGEYGYLGQSGSSETTASQGYTYGMSYNTQNKTTIGSEYGYGLIGGRLGYALGRSLIYIKSGAVFTQVTSTNSSTPVHITDPNQFSSNSTNSGGTTTGYALGGGVEYAPNWYSNKNLTIKVEYLYFGIPTSTNTSGTGTYSSGSPTSLETYHNSTSGIHTAKIGVNYKFW
jgi:outer membrane immunogenic protein